MKLVLGLLALPIIKLYSDKQELLNKSRRKAPNANLRQRIERVYAVSAGSIRIKQRTFMTTRLFELACSCPADSPDCALLP